MSIINDMAATLAAVLPGRSSVYASAPITSGKRFVDFCETDRDLASDDPEAYRERVIEPNLEEARSFAAAVRSKYGNRVIDPSRLPLLNGWSQAHYYSLWAEVVRLHTAVAIFVDGWEYSAGCTYEFLVAAAFSIPTCDERFQPLDKGEALRLIANARADLQAKGQDATFLTERLRLAREPQFRFLKIAEPAFSRTKQQLCALMFGCVVEPRKAVVVFSPVADGKFLSDQGTETDRKTLRSINGVHPMMEVLEKKSNRHKKLLEWVRGSETRAVVIDPTSFTPPHWSRRDIQQLWEEVIAVYACKVVVATDWHYSEDCVVAFHAAVRSKSEIVDETAQPIGCKAAVDLIREGAEYAERCGLDSSRFRAAIEGIITLKSVA